jgi:hypothetical protein
VIIRPAGPTDGAVLATLLAAYLAEQFPGHAGTSAERLGRDVLGGTGPQRVLLAEAAGRPELHGQPPRVIARGLPPKSWDYLG